MGDGSSAFTHFLCPALNYTNDICKKEKVDKMKIVTTIIAIALSTAMWAQSTADVLRYGLHTQGSTARSTGVASSMSPLGADLAVASTNPAGLGAFYKSEFAITFGLPMTSVTSRLTTSSEVEKHTSFKINSLGAVFTSRPNSSTFKTFNFAVGINTLADLSRDGFYSGTTSGTRVERFLELAKDKVIDELDNFEAGLAYDSRLITDQNEDLFYESDFQTLDEQLYKEELIEERGSVNEIYIAAGSNVGDKLAIGATLGLPIINYSRTNSYLEDDRTETISGFQDYIYRQNLQADGGGVNLKLGLIYKPTRKLRLSAAVHSPSWIVITEEYNSSLDFRLDGEENGLIAESPVGNSEYIVRTPWRANAGLGYIYKIGGLKGFLSGEVEYVDYSASNFSLSNDESRGYNPIFVRDLNERIDNDLTNAINLRIGTEIAHDHLRFRAGLAALGNPYGDGTLRSFGPTWSAGLGYRADGWYVDAAIRGSVSDERYTPYRLSDSQFEQRVSTSTSTTMVSLTVGAKI